MILPYSSIFIRRMKTKIPLENGESGLHKGNDDLIPVVNQSKWPS